MSSLLRIWRGIFFWGLAWKSCSVSPLLFLLWEMWLRFRREREREVMICGQWCGCSAEERMPSERDGGREVGRERG